MNQYLAVLSSSITTFAATNVDDAFLLTLFFARRIPASRIVAGQYLGFAAIIGISLIGVWGVFALPHRWIHFLGLLPLAIGIKRLLQTHPGREPRADSESLASIALMTLSNGTDNIGVYVPFFVIARASLWLILSVYVALVALWCFIGWRLGSYPLILRFVDQRGHWMVSLVFVGLGIYVLNS